MGLFSFGNSNSNSKKLDWEEIKTVEALQQAVDHTDELPAVFFKHSTRCSISSMALNRFEKEWNDENKASLYFIDLIAHRDVSNKLSELADVHHQSPQVIVVNKGKTVHHASHNGIDAEQIKSKL